VSFRKLWIYLAVLLFVAGLWAGSEFFLPQKKEGTNPLSLFRNLQTDKITEMQWQRGNETIHLKKNKAWEIIQPISMPADSVVVNNILRTLISLTPEREFSVKGLNLKEFGLDSPRIKFLFLTQGKWSEILVGNKTAVGKDYYVRVSNSPNLFLIQEFLIKELDQDISALREKKVKEGP